MCYKLNDIAFITPLFLMNIPHFITEIQEKSKSICVIIQKIKRNIINDLLNININIIYGYAKLAVLALLLLFL